MDLKRKEFWKTFLRVFLVSLILGVMGSFCHLFLGAFSFGVPILFLMIYGFVEARNVFETRAAIRDESVTRATDYLFAFLRFIAIIIPPAIVVVWLGIGWFVWSFHGYHGK